MGATTEPTTRDPQVDGEPRLADALVQFAHLIDRLFADAGRAHGLTPQQVQLLCELIPGPVGMTELTGTLHVERSSLTGLVDRVERRGLVQRVRQAADRRVIQIALTAKGARLAMKSYDSVTAKVAEITSGVAPANATRLAAIVAGILADNGVPIISGPEVR
ncbi:MarR family winged helix-turn-helix transcriptional regulator [Frankia sp. QA3]|uniref:MarR family winged helix-turn-helix transcriptional regulator n=1 Tax=Frankia sp. QA3 TaxID=710111 RepID=UPI000269C411|nr:MarR family winged helix-turn-helix transcriptional regulator [Frankia sp. QA3]EIV93868.1 transcriptional regulator [Frankia sp. QA3]